MTCGPIDTKNLLKYDIWKSGGSKLSNVYDDILNEGLPLGQKKVEAVIESNFSLYTFW